MNKNRVWKYVVLFMFPILMLLSCDEEPENPKNVTGNISSADTIKTLESDTIAVLTEREFPVLNTENAQEFLLQYFNDNPERKIKLTTRMGVIKFRLFDDTPIHTANFLMLTKREYFNNTEFTRVLKNFVVQGGNNDREEEDFKRILIGKYELLPEIKTKHLHKKGALAMARRYTENPDKHSSAYNFYFVQGQTFNEPQLMAIERDNSIVIPEWKRKIYRNIGGAPHLDGEHTVFGEIYEGLDVLEKMSLVQTDQSDWPLEPLVMEMEVIYD